MLLTPSPGSDEDKQLLLINKELSKEDQYALLDKDFSQNRLKHKIASSTIMELNVKEFCELFIMDNASFKLKE